MGFCFVAGCLFYRHYKENLQDKNEDEKVTEMNVMSLHDLGTAQDLTCHDTDILRQISISPTDGYISDTPAIIPPEKPTLRHGGLKKDQRITKEMMKNAANAAKAAVKAMIIDGDKMNINPMAMGAMNSSIFHFSSKSMHIQNNMRKIVHPRSQSQMMNINVNNIQPNMNSFPLPKQFIPNPFAVNFHVVCSVNIYTCCINDKYIIFKL